MDIARSLAFASPSAQTLLSECPPSPARADSLALTPPVFGCFRKSRSIAETCRPSQKLLRLVETRDQWTNANAARLVSSSKHFPFLRAAAARFTESSKSWKSWLSDEGLFGSLLHSNQIAGYARFLTASGAAKGNATAKDGASQIGAPEIRWVEARKTLLIIYRALLIGAIGLSFSSPVFARPAASETSVALPETSVESDVKKQKGSETETWKSSVAFDEAFWTGLDEKDNAVQLALKTYLEGHPTNIEALECLAQLLVEKNDMQRALKVFEKLELLDPEELEWKYMKAQAHEFTGEFELAKKEFEELLRLQPFSSRALQGLVMVMSRTGEGGSALGVLEASVAKARKENKMAEARNLRMLVGQFHTLKGNLKEALQHYKELIDEDPDDFRPYLCEGIIYSVLGDKDMAVRQFMNYQKLCPKDFPNREFLDELMLKAENEGRKIYDLKQKESASDTEGKEIDMTTSDKSEPESLGK